MNERNCFICTLSPTEVFDGEPFRWLQSRMLGKLWLCPCCYVVECLWNTSVEADEAKYTAQKEQIKEKVLK